MINLILISPMFFFEERNPTGLTEITFCEEISYINPIQMGERGGGGGGGGHTSFAPVTSANIGISSKNFLAFSFNLFATLA